MTRLRTTFQPGDTQRCREHHSFVRTADDRDRETKRNVGSDPVMQQRPDHIGTPGERGFLQDRAGVRGNQQVGFFGQHRIQPRDITAASQIRCPLDDPATESMQGNVLLTFVGRRGGTVDECQREGVGLVEDYLSLVLCGDGNAQRLPEVPEPSAGDRTGDRDALVPVVQAAVRLLAVPGRAAEPFGEEELLHGSPVGEVAREERTQALVVLEPVVEGVDQPVNRRLPTDPIEQPVVTERPEARRVLQQDTVRERARKWRDRIPSPSRGGFSRPRHPDVRPRQAHAPADAGRVAA